MDSGRKLEARLARLEETIVAQKAFCHRVPDPDTRERADGHLLDLIEKRDVLAEQVGSVHEIG